MSGYDYLCRTRLRSYCTFRLFPTVHSNMGLRNRFLQASPLLGVVVAAIFSGIVFGANPDSAFGIHGALVVYYFITATESIVEQSIVHLLPLLLFVLGDTAGFISVCVGWGLLFGMHLFRIQT